MKPKELPLEQSLKKVKFKEIEFITPPTQTNTQDCNQIRVLKEAQIKALFRTLTKSKLIERILKTHKRLGFLEKYTLTIRYQTSLSNQMRFNHTSSLKAEKF